MVIETERLLLREMTERDYDALYKVLADSDIMQHYPYTFDEARVRGWISRNIERYEIFGFGLWAVCLKETGELIGDCGLTMQLINGQIRPEIGYHIRKDRQRQGYAKEAAAAVRDWTFNNTPFNAVYSYMKRENTPSRRTAISYGCKQVDEFEDDENERTVCSPLQETSGAALNSGMRIEYIKHIRPVLYRIGRMLYVFTCVILFKTVKPREFVLKIVQIIVDVQAFAGYAAYPLVGVHYGCTAEHALGKP